MNSAHHTPHRQPPAQLDQATHPFITFDSPLAVLPGFDFGWETGGLVQEQGDNQEANDQSVLCHAS